MAIATVAPPKLRRIALAGNPNAGKTTLFNALTGMRQKVGNYPGVTVEKKEGQARLVDGASATILDLPGTYSLTPKSPDEEVARDVLLGLRADTPAPDAVLIVVDASNLERNLYLATQILELGLPSVIALNMTDVASAAGKTVDAGQLAHDLGCPVFPIIAVKGEGLDALRAELAGDLPIPNPPALQLPPALEQARARVAAQIETDSADLRRPNRDERRARNRVALVVRQRATCANQSRLRCRCRTIGRGNARAKQSAPGAGIGAALQNARRRGEQCHRTIGARTVAGFHRPRRRVFDPSRVGHPGVRRDCFVGFSVDLQLRQLADGVASKALQTGSQDFLSTHLPDGPLRDLLVDGVIAGVGAVLVFLPQILILFFFIGILEDSGYMARAAFIMDKTMGRVGLHGRSFIPLLSSFACAIPGVMATRTISSRRDRMTTILIAPLMSCSARLPVYTLMIGAFIPERYLFGFLSQRAAVMFAMYVLGVLVAMAAAYVFKKTIFKGPPPALLLELPPYKVPAPRNVIVTMWERGSQFLIRAGTTIFALSVILWFALNYPKPSASMLAAQPDDNARAALIARNSAAGTVGRIIEPTIAPLGYNWKIGVGLIGAMAAREVFVSTMGTVYSTGADSDEESKPLRQKLGEDKWPDGRPVWTTATAISILVYFVIAMQCVSTLAVVKRETNSWKWPIFMQVYMTALAWIAAFIAFHGAQMFGL